MSQLLGIGIIGAGSIAESHLSACRAELGARAVAIADLNLDLARERAAKYGVSAVYTDYRELLDNPEVDAVIVCVPNFLHAPVSLAALERGKHVLCEKPMAIDESDAWAMVETAKAQGKILMVGQNYRFHSEVQHVKRMIDEGRLGQIHWARVGWMRRQGIPGWGSWFTQKKQSGGGSLIDIGVHMLDVAWYLMGTPQPRNVTAATFSIFGPRKEGLGNWGTHNHQGTFDVDDGASAVVRFDGGRILTLDVTWAAHHPDRMWIHLMGDRGGVTMFDGPLVVYETVDGRAETSYPHVHGNDIRADMMRHFVHCCNTGAIPLSPGDDGYEVTRMLLGIYRSSEQGREVDLQATARDRAAEGHAS